MTLRGPHIKCLLCQVARIGLGPRQTESELIKRLVVTSHHAFKIRARGHTESSTIRVASAYDCSQSRFCHVESVRRGRIYRDKTLCAGTNSLPVSLTHVWDAPGVQSVTPCSCV